MIKRSILKKLVAHLDEKEITLLIGPRQAGKTTLLRELSKILKKEGKQFLFFNLDKETDFDIFATQKSLETEINLRLGNSKDKKYIFVDEIQRKSDAGKFIKGIYDTRPDIKFILSGSGSVELKEKVSESLAGRKRTFNINTISFDELFTYRSGYKLLEYIEDVDEVKKDTLNTVLLEYLNFGGYPRLVTSDSRDKKLFTIEEIFESYIDKDLKELLNLQKPKSARDLLTVIAAQIGSLLNYSDIASRINISFETTEKYIYYFVNTFMLELVSPYTTNKVSEISKSPIPYFKDLGLRNYLVNAFVRFNPIIDGSFVFQNFIYLLLNDLIRGNSDIRFWRSKDGAEVDFVIKQGIEVMPVEVKYRDLTSDKLSRGFVNFLKKYNPKRAYVVHLGDEMGRKINETQVKFLPYYKVYLLFNSK